MELDDLVIRYQEFNPRNRMIALAVLALLPAAFDFWNRYDDVIQARDRAVAEKVVADGKLNEALDKHKQLSKLEGELTNYQLRMKEASKRLPDEIFMDRILQKTELISEELGLSMKSFKPGEETPSDTAFRYLSLPIRLNLVGTFGQITTFFDHIVHLENLVHIENYHLSVDNSGSDKIGDEKDIEKIEEIKRSQMRIRASCDMVVFRAQTEAEANAIQAAVGDKKKGGKAKGAAPRGGPGESKAKPDKEADATK